MVNKQDELVEKCLLLRSQLKTLRIEFHKIQGQKDNWSDFVAKHQVIKAISIIKKELVEGIKKELGETLCNIIGNEMLADSGRVVKLGKWMGDILNPLLKSLGGKPSVKGKGVTNEQG